MTVRRIPLDRFLVAARAGEHPIARSPAREKPITFSELEGTVGSLVRRIRHEERGRWLVHTNGAFDLAAALLSVWQVGSSALLAPNAQPKTLKKLASECLGVIGDDPSMVESSAGILVRGEPAVNAFEWSELDPSALAVELLTSGTTDARKLVPKTLSQLEAEVATQERGFGERLAAAEVVSTVSHQHLYGLLFQILWPLSAGRVFHDGTCLHPAEVVSRMAGAPEGAVLVSAPVHLKRLAEHDELGRLEPCTREVFSSGGPLDLASADSLVDALGRAPIEVYGSTETGGIAWRRQSRASGAERLAWTPLDGVALRRDEARGILRVRSPFSAPPASSDDAWVETSDLVDLLADGRFLLRGRADRVVKVGEKPVSLPDLEADLCGHPSVEEACCLLVERKPGARTGAVVVLSSEGHALLAEGGRRAVAAELTRHLERTWDRVLLPRIWRYVDRLPRDPLGKVSVASLREVIAEPAKEDGTSTPDLLEERAGPGHHERIVVVPEGLAHFEGHFPHHPVVPGVAQIGWVLEIVHGPLGADGAPVRVEALKFNHVIRPGDQVCIRVERRDDRRKFAFRLSSGSQVFSSGRIVLSEEA